jgi:catechol O-methyltransferase
MAMMIRALGPVRTRGFSFTTAARAVHSATKHFSFSNSSYTRPPSSNADFNEMRERSLLRHVIAKSTEGDPDSVLEQMDVFWDTYFNSEGTAEWKVRGTAIDTAIQQKEPMLALEIGTYCGYTAVRMARLMPEGSKLISFEIDPLFAAIATKVVEHAGLSATVSVEIGSVEARLPVVSRKHGGSLGPVDALLLDHDIGSFVSDLRFLEEGGMIKESTAVLCDWNLYPGSSEGQAPRQGEKFLEYLKSSGHAATLRTTLGDKDVFTVSSWSGVI